MTMNRCYECGHEQTEGFSCAKCGGMAFSSGIYRSGKTGWVPVEDSMPDDGVSVMTFSPESSDPVYPSFLDGGVWKQLDGMLMQMPVTHWQNFPEPPEYKARIDDVVITNEVRG